MWLISFSIYLTYGNHSAALRHECMDLIHIENSHDLSYDLGARQRQFWPNPIWPPYSHFLICQDGHFRSQISVPNVTWTWSCMNIVYILYCIGTLLHFDFFWSKMATVWPISFSIFYLTHGNHYVARSQSNAFSLCSRSFRKENHALDQEWGPHTHNQIPG